MTPKRTKAKKSEMEYTKKKILSDLKKRDLEQWQEASKSFRPLSYKRETRKSWFEQNKSKLDTAREIVDFVYGWNEKLKKDEKLNSLSKTVIRNVMVDVVRSMQEDVGIEHYRLNTVKAATFKTLVNFADNPSTLEEGPYEGKKKLPKDKGYAAFGYAGRGDAGRGRVEHRSFRYIEFTQSVRNSLSGSITLV
ncbi:hypothetical protein EU537_11050 [Candidatus Thorarchaeota archaeon]|nr:MAG: hypothetical protein EU537_11050 [Candidatus Thorarchaeota archaeon]